MIVLMNLHASSISGNFLGYQYSISISQQRTEKKSHRASYQVEAHSDMTMPCLRLNSHVAGTEREFEHVGHCSQPVDIAREHL